MPLLFNVGYEMSDTADAILSKATDSFRAVTVTSGRYWLRVSHNGDTVAKTDIRTSVVIADAKVRKNSSIF